MSTNLNNIQLTGKGANTINEPNKNKNVPPQGKKKQKQNNFTFTSFKKKIKAKMNNVQHFNNATPPQFVAPHHGPNYFVPPDLAQNVAGPSFYTMPGMHQNMIGQNAQHMLHPQALGQNMIGHDAQHMLLPQALGQNMIGHDAQHMLHPQALGQNMIGHDAQNMLHPQELGQNMIGQNAQNMLHPQALGQNAQRALHRQNRFESKRAKKISKARWRIQQIAAAADQTVKERIALEMSKVDQLDSELDKYHKLLKIEKKAQHSTRMLRLLTEIEQGAAAADQTEKERIALEMSKADQLDSESEKYHKLVMIERSIQKAQTITRMLKLRTEIEQAAAAADQTEKERIARELNKADQLESELEKYHKLIIIERSMHKDQQCNLQVLGHKKCIKMLQLRTEIEQAAAAAGQTEKERLAWEMSVVDQMDSEVKKYRKLVTIRKSFSHYKQGMGQTTTRDQRERLRLINLIQTLASTGTQTDQERIALEISKNEQMTSSDEKHQHLVKLKDSLYKPNISKIFTKTADPAALKQEKPVVTTLTTATKE